MICKLIAKDSYYEGMRINDAINIVENKAREKKIISDHVVRDGINAMKTLGKEIAITISGLNSETRVTNTLNEINRSDVSVNSNVQVTDGNSGTELDKVILTDSGIIILEIKAAKSNIVFTEDGRMLHGTACYDKIPLGEKMVLKRKLLKKSLEYEISKRELDIPVFIDSYIVISAPNGKYINIDD